MGGDSWSDAIQELSGKGRAHLPLGESPTFASGFSGVEFCFNFLAGFSNFSEEEISDFVFGIFLIFEFEVWFLDCVRILS